MKGMISWALASGLLFSGLANGEVSCGPEDIVEHRKPIIHFQPFPMENPETGDQYHPNDLIEVPDEDGKVKKVRAADYFAKVNELEESLNQWGKSVTLTNSLPSDALRVPMIVMLCGQRPPREYSQKPSRC